MISQSIVTENLFTQTTSVSLPRASTSAKWNAGCLQSASCDLSVSLDGHWLRHDHYSTYLGVMLDRTLSFREHLTKTAGKLKNRSNLLMKLTGSGWGANAETLWTSALALCYSVAEYCAPVWSRSPHTGLVDVPLNSTMRLISGTLRSTPLPWLPVLNNTEPLLSIERLPQISSWTL